MAKKADEDTQTSLEKIKKRLSNASASCFMEGTLLKRSETLRKWNQRWVTLDPTTGKMEYRVQQGDASSRGLIFFEPESTITLSPINFHGAGKYDGCCFYVGTPQKKEYYLCAESPTVARAWVSTLRAAALVLKAHREAVDSLSGNGHAKLGTVAAVVAAANATSREGMKEMQQSLKSSLKPAPPNSFRGEDVSGDDASTVMKETLRVKDEELNQVARDLRARDYMIKEMADRLSETAEAAEAAASAARAMEKERKQAQTELEDLKKEFDDRLYHAACEVRAGDERLGAALKAREIALQEAQRWRVQLGKGREQIVMMEGAVVRAEDSARRALAEADERVKAAKASEMALLAAKEEAVDQARQWQARADYYQGQAARYLSLLQQHEEGIGNAGTGSQREAAQIQFGDKSVTECATQNGAKSVTEKLATQNEDKAATQGPAVQIEDKTATQVPAVQNEDKTATQVPAIQTEDKTATQGHALQNGDATAIEMPAMRNADKSLTEGNGVESEDKSVTEGATFHKVSAATSLGELAEPGHLEKQASNATSSQEQTWNEASREGQASVPAGDAARDFSHIQSAGNLSGPTAELNGYTRPVLGNNPNYITAVDFEQLQVDTYHVQRPPSPEDSVSGIPAEGGPDHHDFPSNEGRPSASGFAPHEDAGGSIGTSSTEK